MTLASAEPWPATDRTTGSGLAMALAAAALLHLALLATVFWQPSDSGAQAPGQGGLTVSLGPAGAAPGAIAAPPAAPVETGAPPPATTPAAPPDAVASARPAPEAPAPAPPATVPARPAPTDSVTAEPAPPQAAAVPDLPPIATGPAPRIAQPVPAQATEATPTDAPVQPRQAVPALPEAPEPVEDESRPVKVGEIPNRPPETTRAAPADIAPEPVPEPIEQAAPTERVAAEDVLVAAPETSPSPRARPQRSEQPTATPPTADPAPRAKAERPAAPAPAGAGGRGGDGQARDAGSGNASAGGGDPGARADFAARIAAWLARHKAYPRAAQRRRIEGTGVLWFRMDAAGRVTSYRITRSAGHPTLDDAIEETLRRAQPLPPIPAGLGVATMEFSVPVRFALR